MGQALLRNIFIIGVLLSNSLFTFWFDSPVSNTGAWQAKVDPWLLTQFHLQKGVGLASLAGQEHPNTADQVEFLVSLKDQADLSGAAMLTSKAQKGNYVYQRLTEHARRTQAPLLGELSRRGLQYRSFWIANLVWVRGDLADLEALAGRTDVAHIYANPPIRQNLPEQITPSLGFPTSDVPLTLAVVEWNIDKVLAPQVWTAGYRGDGVVIGGQDTGYQWDHPALKSAYRGWDGQSAEHTYNWHDAIHENLSGTQSGNPCGFDAAAPCDDHYHGTHTMGTMVGDDGGANQIGMAPGASWIGCRNMEEGVGTPATYTECFEWFLAPTDLNDQNPRPDLAPDVINNSWSCPPSEGCSLASLQAVIENVRAAGIVVVVSASNYGPSCNTVKEPPAIYDNSFSVGATDSNDGIASFSSRGPSVLTGLVEPDISAPGVSIRSSVPGGYGFLSGTSMAGPHVAGLVALLISADPTLRGQVHKIETLIEGSAVPLTSSENCGGVSGSTIPNNTFGWGRIDAWKAYLETQSETILYFPLLHR